MSYKHDSVLSSGIIGGLAIVIVTTCMVVSGCANKKDTQQTVSNMKNAIENETVTIVHDNTLKVGYYVSKDLTSAYYLNSNGDYLKHYGWINCEWVQAKTHIDFIQFKEILDECDFVGTEMSDLPTGKELKE